jgi:hypothetical protein
MASRDGCRRQAGEPQLDPPGQIPAAIRDFTTGSKQSDDRTAAQSRLNGVRPGIGLFTVVNWAKLCLFSIDLRPLLQ